jgi:transposase-like protein
MSKRIRRFFSDEFKAQAVDLVHHSGKDVAQIAKDLDVTETCLRDWVKNAEGKSARTRAREPKATPATPVRDELEALRREVKLLRMERDILKNRPGQGPICWTRSSVGLRAASGLRGAAGGFLATSNP